MKTPPQEQSVCIAAMNLELIFQPDELGRGKAGKGKMWAADGSRQVDKWEVFVHGSCMGKTITVDDEAYKILSACKEGPGDSFSKVIKRKIFVPTEDGRELLEAMEKMPPLNVDLELMDKYMKGRGRRSGGRR